MRLRGERVSESDLHAYVDDQLSERRREAVARWLAENPTEAETVEAYRRQNDSLRLLFSAIDEEPVPPRLAPEAIAPRRRRGTQSALLAAAVLIGVLLGWIAHAFLT